MKIDIYKHHKQIKKNKKCLSTIKDKAYKSNNKIKTMLLNPQLIINQLLYNLRAQQIIIRYRTL